MFWIVLIIAALFFGSWRNYKKQTADCGPYRRGEKKKDRSEDLRRDTRRRQCAGAADILARRRLPDQRVELVFKS